ncbi:aryl-sulfate sulfotransferase [uncultured Psychroserpens sp.]|uniref:arylsulfotransferase family protein n=1 Tax=uncultured Psychroserpens sp. TaxID=255436 RepID=UPI0026099F6E|nr:aryl-sulfate sulfotransferase [uncultured Psychroserpens sp.]
MKHLLFILILLYSICASSQVPSIGLKFYDDTAYDGYTLFSPEKNNSVYLIDNCGQTINQWDFNETPGLTCYLLENGNLLRAGVDNIEIRDWNNTIIWTFNLESNGISNQHHDIEPLPNGNVLCIVSDNYTEAEMISLGKVPSSNGAIFRLDKVIELEPSGFDSANIVWEWKFIDHLIQDYDNTKPNYGIVNEHPELIDLNYIHNTTQNNDYTHINSIDYNASLDQILLSSRSLNEIYIIDHSTTTSEASGHNGGNSNLGGDILWRWGNPRVYKRGTAADQKLFAQHDAKWVDSGYLDQGKISVFNNGGDGSLGSSSINLLVPEINNGSYTLSNTVFNPQDFDWSWSGSILGETFYQFKKSGVQSLPNGNLLISQTSKGQFAEITKTGQLSWVYKNPTGNGTSIFNQFDQISNSENSVFRAEKYPADYSGFIGQDLTPQTIIENNNTMSENCIASLSTNILNLNTLKLINPVVNNVIRFNSYVYFDKVSIVDIQGRSIKTIRNFNGSTLAINLSPAIYFITLENETMRLIKKIIVQ